MGECKIESGSFVSYVAGLGDRDMADLFYHGELSLGDLGSLYVVRKETGHGRANRVKYVPSDKLCNTLEEGGFDGDGEERGSRDAYPEK